MGYGLRPKLATFTTIYHPVLESCNIPEKPHAVDRDILRVIGPRHTRCIIRWGCDYKVDAIIGDWKFSRRSPLITMLCKSSGNS